jgi:hypothetical protein
LNCNADVVAPAKNADGILEERDPSYEDMLKHMVGRITTKPGGKLEMGEVSLLIPIISSMWEGEMVLINVLVENSHFPSH